MQVKIHMHDRAAAEKWLSEAQQINEDAEIAVKAAAKAVKDIGEMADGTLIDELVLGGEKLMVAAEVLSGTMNTFTGLVKGILDKGEEFLGDGLKYVADAFKSIIK